MHTETIFDLPYDRVVELYIERLAIEANNDIAARTKLRAAYPELFDEKCLREITEVLQAAGRITAEIAARAKIIFYDFKAKKRTRNRIRCNRNLNL